MLIVTGTWVLHEVTQDFSPRIQRIRIKSSVYTITKTYACWFSILIEVLYKSCQTMDSAVFEFLVEIRPGRYSLEFLVGVCAPSSPNPDPILDQKIYFSHRFHTWPLKSIPVFKPSLRNYQDQYIRFIYREMNRLQCYSYGGHKSIHEPHRRDVTHILCKVSSFFHWNPFIFLGYRNDRFSPIQSLYFECYATMPMLADIHISLGYLRDVSATVCEHNLSKPRENISFSLVKAYSW